MKISISSHLEEVRLRVTDRLTALLEIPLSCIVFEILERDAIGDMTNMRKFLTSLRELHFEYVKIDGTFVRNILNSKVDFALMQNFSNLCQDIGILTVAEFVENQQILDALKSMGINYAQGFHISMPIREMRETLLPGFR